MRFVLQPGVSMISTSFTSCHSAVTISPELHLGSLGSRKKSVPATEKLLTLSAEYFTFDFSKPRLPFDQTIGRIDQTTQASLPHLTPMKDQAIQTDDLRSSPSPWKSLGEKGCSADYSVVTSDFLTRNVPLSPNWNTFSRK